MFLLYYKPQQLYSAMKMKLYVYVLRAKDLPATDTYVKLQVGKHNCKTRILKNSNNPVWNEEFVIRVHGSEEGLAVSVFNLDGGDDGSGRDLVGRVWIPVWLVAEEKNQNLPPTWFPLENPNSGQLINEDCGKVLLSLSLHGRSHKSSSNSVIWENFDVNNEDCQEFDGQHRSSQGMHCYKAPTIRIREGKKLMKNIASYLEKVFRKNEENSKTVDSSELASTPPGSESSEKESNICGFGEGIEVMKSSDSEQEMPENLQGGILLDQIYVTSSSELNVLLFRPDPQFRKDLAELQGTTDVEEGPWTWKSGHTSCLTRVVSYTKAASKLVKAVKATEEQTYIKADGREFAVLTNISTPDVPYGKSFNVVLLYKIMPGLELCSGEECSHLTISWGVNFLESTLMKGMIEGGVRQGLKESFDEFANLLAQSCKTLDSMDSSNKDHALATLEAEHQSDWELASYYFWNFTVISTIFMVLYVLVHILICNEPRKAQGLEFNGLELPDSFGQLFTCAVIVIQLERVYNMVLHFIQARLRRGSDHGVKAQGDGWVLTVALLEGSNLPSLDSSCFPDPYVVLTCNGKTRRSSVQLRTSNPQWNDILEFDAMDEPPSVLDVEVFDFEGPFGQATSLGHAEVNFLKHTPSQLADMWHTFEGKLAQSSQSKLHLRIFLDSNKGVQTVKEYLTKMEKEVGKKLNLQSPQKNSMFQKLFGLPPEEFLISDFTCHLKRKLPLQGRLFLSARILGFYANLFGHKTKFFFLWEDIKKIQVLPPSLSSVGSPSLVIVLRKGRGLDARHWAKSIDEEGRLKYYFQSFASFNMASRTIMALWRTKAKTPELKAQIAEEQLQNLEKRLVTLNDSDGILDVEDGGLLKVYSVELSIGVSLLMEMFSGGNLEHKIMENSGCVNYETTTWDSSKPGTSERHLSYIFSHHVSVFGGEVTCTQQKSSLPDDKGWIVNEVMVLHNVPFGDDFHVNIRYRIEKSPFAQSACVCDGCVGIIWLKKIKFQERITRNITDKLTHIVKERLELAEKEILFGIEEDSSIDQFL